MEEMHGSLLQFGAGGSQRITPRQRGSSQGADEAGGVTAPPGAEVVSCGNGGSTMRRDSAGELRAAVSSLEELQRSITHSKSESDIVVVATRAATSRFSGEESCTISYCFKRVF
jgi:hypothetical protein